jgi:pimeloyl-ACP methyl ester carboxylesterase
LSGHGLTRAPDGYVASLDGNADLVNAIADRLHLGPYTLVGNSMGGAVAWNTVLRHPDRVKALVLVDAAGVSPATDFALALRGRPQMESGHSGQFAKRMPEASQALYCCRLTD